MNKHIFYKPDYKLLNNIRYYDSKVENKIAYVYGLSLNTYTASIVKLTTGRFNDCQPTLDTKYESFFNFKTEGNNDIKLFEKYYPESSAYTESINLWYLISENSPNLYWDNTNKCWTSILDHCTFFFTEAAATLIANEVPNSKTSNIFNFKIKYLINNCEINFPCSSFQAKNITDYKTTI